jgi:hypothetical protein
MVAILVGCGQIIGNNPIGVTGGGADGYGSTDASSRRIDPRVVGRWTQYAHYEDEYYLTLNIDGSGIHEEWIFGGPVDSTWGTWSADGIRFQVNIERFNPKSGFYEVSKEELTLIVGERRYSYLRVR